MLLRRSLSVIAVMLVALLLLAACAEETTTTPATTTTPTTTPTTTAAGQYGGVFKIIPTGDVTDIGWPVDARIGQFCFMGVIECLSFAEYGGQNYIPRLATSWELAPDRSSFTINLRQGVKFHDGSDFNAEAVKWNFEQWIEAGKRVDWASIDVIDDYTARVNFNKAYNNLFVPDILAVDAGMISQVAVEKNGIDWARDNPVGTGAFKLSSFERTVRIVYTRNEDYWQEGLPYLDGVEFEIIADPTVASIAMQTGEVNAYWTTGLKVANDLQAAGFEVDQCPSSVMTFFPDGGNPDSPYYDKRVRQAVEYAIDRGALAQAMGYGFVQPAYQFPSPDMVGYDPNFPVRSYDPDKARQLLEDAGYPNGFNTKIQPAPGSISVDAMLIAQQFLAEVGIDAELDLITVAQVHEKLFTGWDNALYGWFGATQMGENVLSGWRDYFGEGRVLMPCTAEPEGFQAILDEALATDEPEDALVRNVYRALFDDACCIPIYLIPDFVIYQSGVHDHGFHTGVSYHQWTPEYLWMER